MKTSEIDKFVGHRVRLWKRRVTEYSILTGIIERKVVGGKNVYVIVKEVITKELPVYLWEHELSPSHVLKIEVIE